MSRRAILVRSDGMKTTRGWSQGKNHGDGGDAFSRGGRRRKAPISLARVGLTNENAKSYVIEEAGPVSAAVWETGEKKNATAQT